MKKKVFFVISSFLFAVFSSALADEMLDVNQIISNTSMPSDAEIQAIVDKFAQNDADKEYLFKETKKQLQELYSQTDKKPEAKTKPSARQTMERTRNEHSYRAIKERRQN